MNKFITILFICFSFAGVASESNYRDTITILDSARTIRVGETSSINLGKRFFIHKLLIQAEGASRQDAYAEVIVNGDIKGTVYLPGRDPHYVVTVAEASRSVEISMIHGAGRFISIKAVVSQERDDHDWEPIPGSYTSKIGKLSAEVIQIVNHLDRYSTFEDYQTYLLPLRRTSAIAIAYAESRGDLSRTARPYYEAVLDTLDASSDFFNRSLAIPLMQSGVIRLMSLREELRILLK